MGKPILVVFLGIFFAIAGALNILPWIGLNLGFNLDYLAGMLGLQILTIWNWMPAIAIGIVELVLGLGLIWTAKWAWVTALFMVFLSLIVAAGIYVMYGVGDMVALYGTLIGCAIVGALVVIYRNKFCKQHDPWGH